MIAALTSPDQCNAAWLTAALDEAGALTGGRVVGVRLAARETTTSTVARLSVRYSRGSGGARPSRLFLKVSSASPKVRLPSDFVLGDVRFYRRIADLDCRLPVPRCYSAAVGPDERSHLLLEDLSSTHAPVRPGPRTPLERCGRMIECLADFHAVWWGRQDLLRRFGPLPSGQEALRYGRSIQERLPGFFRAAGAAMPAATRRLYRHAAARFGPAMATLYQGENLTLVNGDCHPGNVLLRRGGGGGRIVDWQFHHIGLWPQDLMHLLGLCWPPARRRAMEGDLLGRYHRRLASRGVRGLDWPLCRRGYLLGMIDNLFMPMWQWTLNMPRTRWASTIPRAVAAVEDLHCLDVLG